MTFVKLLPCVAFIASSLLAGDAAAPRKAPELAFYLPGEGQKLLSQYRGKVVALEFIQTTCPHCQAAAKVNSKFYSDYAARGFQMIDLAINVYNGGGSDQTAPGLVQGFVATTGANFPVGWVSRGQMLAFMNFSIMDRTVVPQIVLIDRKGFIQAQTPPTSGPDWEKVMSEPAIRAHIEELLAAPKPMHVASAKK